MATAKDGIARADRPRTCVIRIDLKWAVSWMGDSSAQLWLVSDTLTSHLSHLRMAFEGQRATETGSRFEEIVRIFSIYLIRFTEMKRAGPLQSPRASILHGSVNERCSAWRVPIELSQRRLTLCIIWFINFPQWSQRTLCTRFGKRMVFPFRISRSCAIEAYAVDCCENLPIFYAGQVYFLHFAFFTKKNKYSNPNPLK